MQLSHAEQGLETSTAIRGGAREFKTLLMGEEDAPDNYRIVLSRQAGKVYVPRHRHNFDQIRMCLEGGAQNYGPDRWINPGEIVYFPEGTAYGPEDSETTRRGITIQFGGASGHGFLSSRRTGPAMEEMRAFGTFEKGVFQRTDDPPAGVRRKQDAYEAIWEYVNQRQLAYPDERYDEPVMMRARNFAWQPVDGMPGVSTKLLGTYSERRVEISMLRAEKGATAAIAPRPGARLCFVLDGEGEVGGQGYKKYSAFSLDRGEGTTLTASLDTEVLSVGLPIFEPVAADAI